MTEIFEKTIQVVKNDSGAVEAIKDHPLWAEGRAVLGENHFGINMYLRNIIRTIYVNKDYVVKGDVGLIYPIPQSSPFGGEMGETYLLDKLWKTFNNIELSSADIIELDNLYAENEWEAKTDTLRDELIKRKIDFWINKKT